MYISLMAMEKDGFIRTLDTVKSFRHDLKRLLATGKRLDTLWTPFQLRQEIIKAAKIVVGLDIMNLSVKSDIIHPAEHVWGKKDVSAEFKENKRAMYAQFARMPFAVLFIENWTGAHLVKRNPDGITWTQTTLMHVCDPEENLDFAMALGVQHVVDPRRVDADGFIWAETIRSSTIANALGSETRDYEIGRSQSRVHATQVAETLMFLNVKNAEPQRYIATKADIKATKIPKVFAAYCDYRVLDIYRNNEPIKSMVDLVHRTIGSGLEERAEARAHLVRGHFKNIRGSLYWWNPYMRNRQRLETHGFVDKDYQLIT